MIGSTSERNNFFDELRDQVAKSEAADQEKERARIVADERKKLEIEVNENKKKYREDLRLSREARVYPEVNLEEAGYMLVSVRHVHLGVLTRSFRKEWTVSSVYDWIGSLSSEPEHFSLISPVTKKVVYPDALCETAERFTFYMNERENPIPLAEDEVFFFNGDSSLCSRVATIVDDATALSNIWIPDENQNEKFTIEPVASTPPLELLTDDVYPTNPNDGVTMSAYEQLQVIRQAELEKMNESCSAVIDKSCIVEEVLQLYKDDTLITKNLSVNFLNEDATGNGVLREMFSTFWNEFFSENGNGYSQFTFRLHPNFSLENYPLLGKIITHQFLLCGTIPIQLARACFQEIVTGAVESDDKCLIESFLSMLPSNQEEVIAKALGGHSFQRNEIIEVLSEYDVHVLPSSSNILQTILQVAKAEFLHKPYIALKKIQESMPYFWNDVSTEHIQAMYQLSFPSRENILKVLSSSPSDMFEEKVFRWFLMYVKQADDDILRNLIQFITASSVIIPGECISVRYEGMPLMARRPKSQTCFKILVLPKNYPTFRNMKDNLDFYLNHQSEWDLQD